MKNKIQALYLLILILGFVSCKKSNKTADKPAEVENELIVEKTSNPSGIDGNCVAPLDWFNGSVPEPKPKDFPPDSLKLSNCDFHLVSWQYFLWLTEEVNGKLRFESYFTNKAIHPESKNDQYHVLDIVEQALSKGLLVDQNNRALYSNILINDIYRDWVLDNKLYDPEVYANFDPTRNFPVGSVSLKTSWKIVQPGEDVSKLHTSSYDIELLSNVKGVPRIDKNNPKIQKNVNVALVGLHIAVVVKGHPEFIWASFEFDGNAPDFGDQQDPNKSVSDKDWLLYKANTTARQSNANNARTLSFINENDQTLKPVTQVARQFAQGGGSETNIGNIKHLNTNVKEQLSANSKWRNYFEVGAVWFNTDKGVLKPKWDPNIDNTMVTGSIKLSNSTIETFTQNIRSENQCFSCHNSMGLTDVPQGRPMLAGKNINTSHILLRNYNDGREIPISN
ncbi:hypothetical protein [Mariniflexile sp. AS56]|uniref:hypothetical protein n=1 Tax=Mariniflexile sp. AS56 TaxID=3063957 RepID=UPI0026ED686C|nr:hypothetical protein [Mariniflexile sp. AS56]MDO7172664.1 hypothetical protein [Mariniflexile sp. AS56]